MLDNLNKYQIILASNSPRRKELMSGLGVDYVVRTLPDVDESYPDTVVGAEDDILYYVDRYQPMDKAGAYGVQEWIGYIGVKSISGSFYNIMGLPIQKLYGELKKL